MWNDSGEINLARTPEEFWGQYEKYAQTYLNRPIFKGTPLTGKMLRLSAENTYNTTKTFVPVDFALSQAQLESSMGRRSRYASTNPFNVGEYDKGTRIRFKTLQDGVNSYYTLMANDYLKGTTPQQLLTNFVNFRGDRYASNPEYERKMRNQIKYINRYVSLKGAK